MAANVVLIWAAFFIGRISFTVARHRHVPHLSSGANQSSRFFGGMTTCVFWHLRCQLRTISLVESCWCLNCCNAFDKDVEMRNGPQGLWDPACGKERNAAASKNDSNAKPGPKSQTGVSQSSCCCYDCFLALECLIRYTRYFVELAFIKLVRGNIKDEILLLLPEHNKYAFAYTEARTHIRKLRRFGFPRPRYLITYIL